MLQQSGFAMQSLRAPNGYPSIPTCFAGAAAPGTREAVVHPDYILIYEVGADALEIMRVILARREYP